MVNVFGVDSIDDEFKNKTRLYIIPKEIFRISDDNNYMNYWIDISNSHKINGIKPGAYIIGIRTQYRVPIIIVGAGVKIEMPNNFYSWDGWTENPGLRTLNGKMFYTTYYSREIEPSKTSLIVALRN